jgi:hypothetical protein
MKRSRLGSLFAGSLLLAAAGGYPLCAAGAEQRGLEVSLRPAYEIFSQHGPVDGVLHIQNRSREQVKLDLGLDHKAALLVTFHLPDGTLVRPPYPQLPDGSGASGDLALAAGQSYEEILVLNDWQTFDQPGSYEIEVALPPVQEPPWQRSQRLVGSGRFRVVPRDPARLEATCRRLQAATLGQDALDAGHALSFAADEVCVPSLVAVLRTSFLGTHGAIQGLAKLGSPAAVAAIVSTWDDLHPTFKEIALVEFSHAKTDGALREALRRAGKKEVAP